MPEGFTAILVAVLGLAVLFDYINGFHDTANAIATSVSTRALQPQWAIAMRTIVRPSGTAAWTPIPGCLPHHWSERRAGSGHAQGR